MASTQFLQKAYLAYFGRPVDPTGAIAFQNSSEIDVLNAFYASAESQSLYGTSFGATQVNAIYQMLFGRDAEPAGLSYWLNQVATGALTPAGAALGILNGALNADATAVTNKLAASAAFTAALDTTAEILGYSGNAAAASARAFLQTVTATPATADAVTAAVAKCSCWWWSAGFDLHAHYGSGQCRWHVRQRHHQRFCQRNCRRQHPWPR